MNLVGVTGYLIKDAARAFTTGGAMKLVFDVMVDNERGAVLPWRCEIDQLHLIEKYEALLTSGRPFIIEAKLDGRAFEDHGVHKGYTRFLHVLRAEFPERGRAVKEEEQSHHANV